VPFNYGNKANPDGMRAAVVIAEVAQILERLASESAIDDEDSFKLKRVCYNYTNFGQSIN